MTYFEPALPLLLLLGFTGVARAWRRSAENGRPWLQTVSLVGIWLLSIEAGAWVMSRPLEAWYPVSNPPRERADAIVVLAGAVNGPVPARPYVLAGQDTYRRVQHAAWLFRTWQGLPILVSGGVTNGTSLAETMRQILTREGIPGDKIWVEPRAMNTRQSALYAAEILRAHGVSRIALIVEANSMPRASLSFQKMGLEVLPAPARFIHSPDRASDFVPEWSAIALNDETVHEFVGLIWYKLRGWI